jgi:hypothetical protein
LHQAVEAKEGVKIQQESRTYASITYQNFFRMYPKLAGMTGTASTSAEEFYKVYALDVYSVPTNVPAQRQDKNDLIFRTEIGKYKAIARKVKELNAKGQPVLIGTVTIEKNELLSKFLKAEGFWVGYPVRSLAVVDRKGICHTSVSIRPSGWKPGRSAASGVAYGSRITLNVYSAPGFVYHRMLSCLRDSLRLDAPPELYDQMISLTKLPPKQ